MTDITSRANPKVTETAKLSEKKYREKSRLFTFEGKKLLGEALDAGIALQSVFVTEEAAVRYIGLLDRADCPVYRVPAAVYEKLTEEKSPEGILTCAKYLDNSVFPHIIYLKCSHFSSIMGKGEVPPQYERLVVCEGLQDPGNLGTVLRTANALGYDRVVLSSDSADVYNPRTVRAAMGALFRIRIDITENICAYLRSLADAGYHVYAAALHRDAQMLGEMKIGADTVFLIGNEGHGLSEAAIEACCGTVMIPMTEGAESLNASVAAAILMWERAKAEI